jgi:hypothetical protein
VFTKAVCSLTAKAGIYFIKDLYGDGLGVLTGSA